MFLLSTASALFLSRLKPLAYCKARFLSAPIVLFLSKSLDHTPFVFGFCVPGFSLSRLHPLLELDAQQTFRPQQEHYDDQKESEGILERDGDVSTGPRFRHSKDQAADDRAGEAVKTAKNRSSKAFEKRFQHKEWIEEQDRGKKKPCQHSKERGEPPGKGQHHSRGYAKGLSGRKVFGSGPHGQAELRLLDEEIEYEATQETDRERPEAQLAYGYRAELVDFEFRQWERKRLRFGAACIGDYALDDQTQPQGEDDLAELRSFTALSRHEDTEIECHRQTRAEK